MAGKYRGVFTEDMFDVGQPLDHPYHRTKFESERLVRETATMPWRIYRPSIVIGDSRTGRIDKADGPYYFLPLLKRAHQLVPDWLPLIGPELGNTNLVPVDFVAAALDHIAHQPGLDGQAFHLTDPQPDACRRCAEHVRQGRRTRHSSRSPSTRGRWRSCRGAWPRR